MHVVAGKFNSTVDDLWNKLNWNPKDARDNYVAGVNLTQTYKNHLDTPCGYTCSSVFAGVSACFIVFHFWGDPLDQRGWVEHRETPANAGKRVRETAKLLSVGSILT
jgi:hypothetical protein